MMKKLPLFILIFFGFLALWPFISGSYGIDLVAKIMIYALLALSLELLVGTTGLVCFGQAAFFGIGAYSVVLLSATNLAPPLFVSLIGSILLAGVFALLIGSLSLRTKGVYFIMVTLAFSQMVYYVVHDTPLGGGTDGVYMYVKPTLGDWLDLDKQLHIYGFIWASLLLAYVFFYYLLRSPFGRALAGIRVNEQRMQATGFSVYPYKLAAFTISGAVAGWAGYLFAVKDGFVNPELLSWHLSGALLVMIILGGLGYMRGALVGAFAFALLQELFQSEAVFGAYAKHWHLGLGLTIIACVAFMPNGLVALPKQLRERLTGRHAIGRGGQQKIEGGSR